MIPCKYIHKKNTCIYIKLQCESSTLFAGKHTNTYITQSTYKNINSQTINLILMCSFLASDE